MAYFERIRDIVSEPFSPDVLRQRSEAGWQMVAIEWRRELPGAQAPTDGEFDDPDTQTVMDKIRQLNAEDLVQFAVRKNGIGRAAGGRRVFRRWNGKNLRPCPLEKVQLFSASEDCLREAVP